MFKTSPPLGDVFAQRAGRVVSGLILIAGALMLGLHAPALQREHATSSIHAWQIVVGTWVAAFAAGLLGFYVLSALPRPHEGNALRRAALVVPSVGLALILPITLHLIVMGGKPPRAFDDWVYWSVMFTTHTHVVFALLVGSRALALANDEKPVSVPLFYCVTCGIALIPVGIPMFFVALTGVPIVPLLLWMKRVARLDRERSRDIPFAIARIA